MKNLFFGLLIFFLSFNFVFSEEPTFQLELNYPFLGNQTVTLPQYVNYLFTFAIIAIGFIIFGSLVYGGILYITSFGEPAKYGEAKKKISSAFFGGAILLSSWILFTTIRPGIETLTVDRLLPIGSSLSPGFYICQNNIGAGALNINIKTYVSLSQNVLNEQRIDERRGLIENQDNYRNRILNFIHANNCRPINMSMAVSRTNLGFTPSTISSTIFAIPMVTRDSVVLNQGLIIHSHDNFRGRCEVVPPPAPSITLDPGFDPPRTDYVIDFSLNGPYQRFITGNSDGNITSLTVYNWLPLKENEDPSNHSVTFYKNVNLDHERFFLTGETQSPPVGAGLPRLNQQPAELLDDWMLHLRSFSIKGSVIAIISSNQSKGGQQDNPRTHCAVIDKDINVLVNHHAIGTVCRLGTAGNNPDLGEDEISRRLSGRPTCATHYQLIRGEKL